MHVKKYVAPTLRIATEQMKNELGNEAVILSTRVLKEDYPGSKMFELTAGFDADESYNRSTKTATEVVEELPKSFEDELEKISNKIYRSTAELEKILRPVKPIEKPSESLKQEQPDLTAVEEIVKKLSNEEISKPIIKQILEQLKKYGKLLQVKNSDSLIISTIASMIPTKEFNVTKGNKPKVVSLVGPTGVGKTTCIAKLAIVSKILHDLDVGLVSIDTYRLGALDQLKVFSDVSNIDMLVAYEPQELTGIMQQFKNKDVIFIDTAGRSQKNTESLSKALDFLDYANVDETYLVMNSTLSTKTMIDVAEKFELFDYNALIFTKIDEGVVFGNLLNLISKIKVPTVFLTNGQVIPDDIISADADYIAKLIYTGKIL